MNCFLIAPKLYINFILISLMETKLDDIDALELGLISTTRFKVHPSVPLQILESYYRRKNEFVIGTLLGEINNGLVKITNCYPVPCKVGETGKIGLHKDYHKDRYDLNKKVYTREKVLGWFTTLTELDPSIAIIHAYYGSPASKFESVAGTLPSPILLTIDPTM